MKNVLAERIATAIDEVTSAEKGLADVLRQIRSEQPRAEKTWTISKAVEEAFARLKVAKANLIDLEKLTTTPDE
jgi:hypothetical protein